MKVTELSVSGVCAAILLVAAPAAANAALYNFNYSGVVAQTSFPDPDPDYPASPDIHVGDKFFGAFTIDTNFIGDDGQGTAEAPLSSISFNLPRVGYTENFEGPLGEAYSSLSDGSTSIIGGRPDFGRQLSIDLNLGASNSFDPTRLFGKSGAFTFSDNYYGGFQVQGIANIAAISSVPEPATWGMMIVGLGLAGAAARRRRRKVSTRVSYAL